MMGSEGLTAATKLAIVNANYIGQRLPTIIRSFTREITNAMRTN